MAESTKYTLINGGTTTLNFTDLKTHFSVVKTRRSVACAYGFVFVFIVVTTFLAFSPSPNSSSPWFTNIFSPNTSNKSSEPPHLVKEPQIGLNYTQNNEFLDKGEVLEKPLNQSTIVSKEPQIGLNYTQNNEFLDKVGVLEKPLNQSTFVSKVPPIDKVGVLEKPLNQSRIVSKEPPNGVNNTQKNEFLDKAGVLGKPLNQSTIVTKEPPIEQNNAQGNVSHDKVEILEKPMNQSTNLDHKDSSAVKNDTQSEDFDDKVGVFKANQSTDSVTKGIQDREVRRNFTSSLVKKQNSEDLVKSLLNCDFFDGNWVTDESYPLYKPGSCSLIDEQFNCALNGRPDSGYLKMKWKPKSCSLPRLNATHMLELLRGMRLVFVGDSLNRNMWESLICILRNSVKDQKKVYEENGRHHFRTEASYSFIFEEYKCRVEFFASPFLVQQWEVADKKGGKKETLRLDLIGESADKYKTADILVFNTGHWWTHEKTSLGKDYYQEGSHVYSQLNVLEAFRKAITTWGKWVDAHINPKKTFVLFRGYSASHFSGGQWNSGGACDSETEPITNDKYLTPYPSKMTVLENVFKGMKTQVSYLNITRMSDYRKDGHPSIYRKPNLTDKERRAQWRYQDCSHWCLPGVPDAWNELLYAEILVRLHQKQQDEKS